MRGSFQFRGLVAPRLCSAHLARFPLGTFERRGLVAPCLCSARLARFPLGTFEFRVSSRPKIARRSAQIGRRWAQDWLKSGQIAGSYGLDAPLVGTAENVEKHREN